ncbi:TonB-dependent receptor plug domain-containing protein [Chryseobacterium sp. SN22]|uniref:TonB-dependent receptor n=1 Tax=Chryseobacterium sp. SN22 TaxID=2606431 RepID=UPI0011F08276|nr:TonB-dependent receptor plug domain-containing protein [Chryseobacterium sp. SN22]KAA0130460.1 TonB-dependent receptor plug domain-containing protein [Chryseobacterium sp. SN22]
MIRYLSVAVLLGGTTWLHAQENNPQLNINVQDENHRALKGATVIIENSTAITDNNGNATFSLQERSGKYYVKIIHPDYQEKETDISSSLQKNISFHLQPADKLEEVVVFSRESKGLTTKSVIDRQAMQHLQPSSFSDLMELIPGGLAKTPDLSSVNRPFIRENPNNFSDSKYKTSSLGVQFMIDDNIINSNADMQLSVDNSQFNYALRSRETAFSGIDMRTISTNDIEKVEVIRGIPSASYGDLTSGLIKIERKIGQTPLQARFKTDGFSKQYYVGKGFKINEKWQISASADFLDSKATPTDDFENYQRITASLRSKKIFRLWLKTLDWRSNIDFSTNIDRKKYDPDNGNADTDQYEANNRKISFANNFTYYLDKNSFFSKVTLNTSIRAGFETIRQTKLIQLSGPRSFSLAYEQGENVGFFPVLRYVTDFSTEGKPLDITALFRLNGTKKTAGIVNNYEAGLDWRYSKNNGAGLIYDMTTPPSASSGIVRPRSFNDIPASNLLAAFAGNQMSYAIRQHTFTLYAGVRLSQNMGIDPLYTISKKVFTEPRVNFQYSLPHLMINNYPVKTEVTLGYGMFYKQPTLLMLYPNKQYWDYTQLNYYHNDAQYRYVNFMTYVQSRENKEIEAAKSIKREIRLDVGYRNHNLFITYFKEDMTNGFREMLHSVVHTYKQYDASQVDLTQWTAEGPDLTNVPYTVKNNFTAYPVTENGSATLKQGIEFGYSSPRIKAINTRFTLTGAYFKTQYRNSVPVIEKPTASIGTEPYPYYGIYSNDLGYVYSNINYNLLIDTYLPSLDLIVSASLQGSLFDHRRNDLRIAEPISYYGTDGIVHPFTNADRTDLYKQWLVRNVSTSDNLATLYTFTLTGNIKVTKSIYKTLRASMFVNRLFNYSAPYTFNNVTVYRKRMNTPYFGMELNYNF